jgi:hypothetical protein
MTLTRILKAEALKIKNTLAFWLAILVPLAVVVLQFLIFADRGYPYETVDNMWEPYILQTLNWWTLLMLPLFITLLTALTAGLEHNNHMWKKLFALPVPRWMMYATKQFSSMLLIGISWLALLAFILLSGYLLQGLNPELGFGRVPLLDTLKWISVCYIASWLLISIHTFISLRWKSFVVASAVGIVMTVAGMAVINSDYGPYYPWTLTAMVLINIRDNFPYLNLVLVGAAGGVLTALIGGWRFLRHDVL